MIGPPSLDLDRFDPPIEAGTHGPIPAPRPNNHSVAIGES
jgi:hypothetical protein